jgi:hypothetical protein
MKLLVRWPKKRDMPGPRSNWSPCPSKRCCGNLGETEVECGGQELAQIAAPVSVWHAVASGQEGTSHSLRMRFADSLSSPACLLSLAKNPQLVFLRVGKYRLSTSSTCYVYWLLDVPPIT